MTSTPNSAILPPAEKTACRWCFAFGKQRWEDYLLQAGQLLGGVQMHLPAAIARWVEVLTAGLSGYAGTLVGSGWFGDATASPERFWHSARFHHALVLPSLCSAEKLRAISEIQQKLSGAPAAAREVEAFQTALTRLSQGLIEKALEKLREAEDLNEANFLTQLLLGQLRLYGIDEYVNTIDIAEAEKRLLSAARFVRMHVGDLPDWNRYAAEAHLHASIASYALASEAVRAGSSPDATTWLMKAADHARKAAALYPGLAEAAFQYGRVLALLGRKPQAVAAVKAAIAADPNCILRLQHGPEFSRVGLQLRQLFEELRREAQAEFDRRFEDVTQFDTSRHAVLSRSAVTDLEAVAAVGALRDLRDSTYFDLLGGIAKLAQLRAKLDELAADGRIGDPEAARRQAESALERVGAWQQVLDRMGVPRIGEHRRFQELKRELQTSSYYCDTLRELEQLLNNCRSATEEQLREAYAAANERADRLADRLAVAEAMVEHQAGIFRGGGILALVAGAAAGFLIASVLNFGTQASLELALVGAVLAFGWLARRNGALSTMRARRKIPIFTRSCNRPRTSWTAGGPCWRSVTPAHWESRICPTRSWLRPPSRHVPLRFHRRGGGSRAAVLPFVVSASRFLRQARA